MSPPSELSSMCKCDIQTLTQEETASPKMRRRRIRWEHNRWEAGNVGSNHVFTDMGGHVSVCDV